MCGCIFKKAYGYTTGGGILMALQQITDIKHRLAETTKTVRQTKRAVLFSHVEAVPTMKPLQIYQSSGKSYKGERFYWENPEGNLTLCGMGVAAKLQPGADSVGRFSQVKDQWGALLSMASVNHCLGEMATGPILFGGFSFMEGETGPIGLWEDFGDYLFYLPRFLLTESANGTFLTSTKLITEDCDDCSIERFLKDREQLMSLSPAMVEEIPSFSHMEERDVEKWKEAIERSVEDIRTGLLDKVVLAREVSLHFEGKIPSGTILQNLTEQQPGSFIFGVESGESCFLGASPERLIKKEGKQIFSACLAGSIKRGDDARTDEQLGLELWNDEKNRSEHEFVVSMMRKAMEEQCIELDIPQEPILMKLANIQHLYTPVKGTSLPNSSILEFVELLHPTPALGGAPRKIAMEKISEYEQMERGFYSSPVGWMDMKGNGDFAVGIRSGLLKGGQASLFAGCGIVEGSIPESELTETKVKFKPMLNALGGLRI